MNDVDQTCAAVLGRGGATAPQEAQLFVSFVLLSFGGTDHDHQHDRFSSNDEAIHHLTLTADEHRPPAGPVPEANRKMMCDI
jgi:hypothetical protein